MRRFFLVVTFFLAVSAMAYAVPAWPGTYTYTQPDGTVIRLRSHGDEWYHWTTDEAGNTVELDHVGYYRVVQRDHSWGISRAKALRAQANERRRAQHDPTLTVGSRHIPVVLVSFKDLDFSISDPQQAFSKLLNEQGYSNNGGKGSVRDYYSDNSSGAFTPVFDVLPPYQLSKDYAYYDTHVKEALLEACKYWDSTVDFSQYDQNNDGYVDMILFYYAGFNEAEYGPTDSIWPHQGGVYTNDTFDGLKLGTYFCTSELRWNEEWSATNGKQMCGIGTTCHEFAHSLGLPDFYDTDGETNGTCTALASYSMMCNGSYLDSSNRPAGLTALERDLLGWLTPGDGFVEITSSGSYIVPPVQQNKAYFTKTATEGEYFIYECRAGTGWDTKLPTGLVIYHVDQSERMLENGSRAIDLWTKTNSINAYGDHPCYTLVPSKDPTLLLFDDFSLSQMIWKNNKSYTPVDWDGQDTGVDVSGITYSASQVRMYVNFRSIKGLQGKVLDTAGSPVLGATVRVGSVSATTDASGAYSMSLSGVEDGVVTVEVSRSGYHTLQQEYELGRFLYTLDFVLLREGETPVETLKKYESPYAGYIVSFGTSTGSAGSFFTAEELSEHVGKQILSIDFLIAADSADAAYVLVETGPLTNSTCLLKYPVSNLVHGWNHVDISGEGFTIPAGKDLILGYHVDNADDPHFIAYENTTNGSFVVRLPDYGTKWWDNWKDSMNAYVSAQIKAKETPVEDNWIFPSIDNPGNGNYAAGGVFALTLNQGWETPSSVTWSYDGGPATSNYVALVAGTHLVEATLTYPDGSTETVRLTINVQ